ncbi:MAG: hypothetical protein WC531_01085 [Candidatus Paceibacterota bacterium]|jgi:hypothetical protein
MSQTSLEIGVAKGRRITKPVRLPDDLHRLLKIEAASQETTVLKLLTRAVIEHFGFLRKLDVENSELNDINNHEELRTTI